MAERLLKIPFAGTQHHHLHIHIHDLWDGGGHQFEALVPDQAGDAGDDGHIGVLTQPHRPLQRGLAGGLPAQIVGREGRGQPGTVGGVVEVRVQAVEDALQLPAVVDHHALQAVGIEGILELLGIGGGDRGHIVGGINGPFHQIHVPVIGQHMLIHIPAVQTQQVLQHLVAVTPLVLDIVDGEHALASPQLPDPFPLLQEVNGHQGGLPVVAVDDVRVPVQVGRRLDDGTGEKGEPLAVVIVAVDLGAFEIIFVVHEEVGDVVLPQLQDAAVGRPPGHPAVPVAQELHFLPVLLRHALIEREDHLYVVSHFGQLFGQGAGHIGQAAGFDKRGYLGRGEQNIHTCLLFIFSGVIHCAAAIYGPSAPYGGRVLVPLRGPRGPTAAPGPFRYTIPRRFLQSPAGRSRDPSASARRSPARSCR